MLTARHIIIIIIINISALETCPLFFQDSPLPSPKTICGFGP
jgi:hypothetical protein